ncbi:MAG: RNA polymerase sigma factor [Chloroflexia bacterium]|nr:RNA polymerase sigma factor [Chloroflexia bacterium]
MSAQMLATAGATMDQPPLEALGVGPTVAPSFSTVVADHGDAIYRYAWHLTRNQTDADDIYQETLLKAYRAYGKLDGDANHRAWLYRIASNTFISDRRKRNRENPLTEAMEQTVPAPAVEQADGLDARDLLREVEHSVTELPPKQRAALILRKYHEASYAEIAVSLNTSEVAARANVHEALKKLRTQFADRLDWIRP